MKITTRFWIGIGVLILVSPLGLILPERFKAGDAWGEWSSARIQELVGYVPAGLKKLSGAWKAPLPDYALNGWEEKGLPHLSLAYILSAIAGVGVILAIVFLIGKILAKKGK